CSPRLDNVRNAANLSGDLPQTRRGGHTGSVARAKRAGARGIALLLGLALVASGVVAYALIKVTAPGPGGGDALPSGLETVTESVQTDPVSPADVRVSADASTTSSGPEG